MIEELKSEINQLKRGNERETKGKPGSSQRYYSYIDTFERETVKFTQAKIAEETLALQQGLKRGKNRGERAEKGRETEVKRHYEGLE